MAAAAMGYYSQGLKNEFETAMVKEPSVFEPQKFYCIMLPQQNSLDNGVNGLARMLSGDALRNNLRRRLATY